MIRPLAARLAVAALFLLGAWIAYTQNPAPAQLTINKIKDDLYEIEGDGGNVAVYITSEGVILVDDKFEPDYDQIMARIKSVTDSAGEVRALHPLPRGSQRREHEVRCPRPRSSPRAMPARTSWSTCSPTPAPA